MKILTLAFALIFFCIMLSSLVFAQDIQTWKGQYYTGTNFNQGTFNFNFTIYDDKTAGSICYSNTTSITTTSIGYWEAEQNNINTVCNNIDEDYFLEIKIDGNIQGERKRLNNLKFVQGQGDRVQNLTVLQNFNATNIIAMNNISAQYFLGDGSLLTNLPSGGNLSFNQSLASTLYYSTSNPNNFQSGLTHLSNFTDNLGNRGLTHLSNFTNNLNLSSGDGNGWTNTSTTTSTGLNVNLTSGGLTISSTSGNLFTATGNSGTIQLNSVGFNTNIAVPSSSMTIRQVIKTSGLSQASGSGNIKVTFTGYQLGTNIRRVYIGVSDSVTEHKFASAPTQLFFSGSEGTSLGGGQSKTTDEASFSYNSGDKILIAFELNPVSNYMRMYRNSNDGRVQAYVKIGAWEADSITPSSGYVSSHYFFGGYNALVYNKIELVSSGVPVVITNDGKLGIGVTNPTSKLEIDGDIACSKNEGCDIGKLDKRFKGLYLSSNTLWLGNTSISVENGGLKINDNDVVMEENDTSIDLSGSNLSGAYLTLGNLTQLGRFRVDRGQAVFDDGSETAPSIVFESNLDRGFYRCVDGICFAIGGSRTIFFSSDSFRPTTVKDMLLNLGKSDARWNNFYLSGNIYSNGSAFFDGNVTANKFIGDGSLLTGVSGGNASWNQSLANTLYSNIQYNHNQTAPANSYTDIKVSTANLHLHNILNITGVDDNACIGTNKVSNVTFNNGNLIITCSTDESGSGSADGTGGWTNTSTDTTTDKFVVVGSSGTETSNALFAVKTTTRNALAGVGDKNNYLLELAYDANTNGNGIGLAFRSSTDSGNVGAAIIHERTGSNSQGKLNFYTKQSATVGVAPVKALTLTETGTVLVDSLIGIYTGGSAHVCVYDNGTLFASEGACP